MMNSFTERYTPNQAKEPVWEAFDRVPVERKVLLGARGNRAPVKQSVALLLVLRGLLCGWQSHKSPGASLCGWIRAQVTLSLHFFFSHALNCQLCLLTIILKNEVNQIDIITNLDVDKRNRRKRGIINWRLQ